MYLSQPIKNIIVDTDQIVYFNKKMNYMGLFNDLKQLQQTNILVVFGHLHNI